MVTGWLTALLIGVSVLLQARSFYMIYVRKTGTRATKIITWAAFTFMVCFWTWYLVLGGSAVMEELFKPNES